MVASFVPVSAPARAMVSNNSFRCLIRDKQIGNMCSALVASVLVGCVIVFVPESPQQLASICEKHNSVVACQVF